MNLFVFEHLDFGVKGELEAKLVCSNIYVILGICLTFILFVCFLHYIGVC